MQSRLALYALDGYMIIRRHLQRVINKTFFYLNQVRESQHYIYNFASFILLRLKRTLRAAYIFMVKREESQ